MQKITNFSDALVAWRRYRMFMLSFTLLCGLSGYIMTVLFDDIYSSSAVIIPNLDLDASGFSPNGLGAGLVGGLLSGFNGGGDQVRTLDKVSAILSSRKFANQFIDSNELAVKIFAGQYDSDLKSTQIDQEKYDTQRKVWLLKNNLGLVDEPTPEDKFEKFSELFWMDVDDETYIITFGVNWINPQEAQLWLSLIIEAVDNELRQRSIAESDSNLEFLLNSLNTAVFQEQKDAIKDIYVEQLGVRMFANAPDAYFLRILDPPNLAERPVFPNTAMFVGLSTILGFLLSILTVSGYHFWNVTRKL